MKVTICPIEKVFEDLFCQDLEFLFLKEEGKEDKTIIKVINAYVKSIKSAENSKTLLAVISQQ